MFIIGKTYSCRNRYEKVSWHQVEHRDGNGRRLDFEDDFDFEFKDADEMNQEITLDEGTEDAVEDIAEETVAVSEDEE